MRPKFNSEKKFWLPDGYYYNGILTGYLNDVGIAQPFGKTGLYFPNLTMFKIGLSSRLFGNLVYLFTFVSYFAIFKCIHEMLNFA